MSFAFSSGRALRLAISAAGLCLFTANALAWSGSVENSAKASLVGRSSCNGRDDCIDAILNAARAGRHIEQLSLTRRLESLNRSGTPAVPRRGVRPNRGAEAIGVGNVDVSLTTVLRGVMKDYAAIPDYRRALVLAYFKAGQVLDADRELRGAIESAPTYAAFWVDLAMILHRQGRTDDAVSALVVADSWTQDVKALRMGYESAAKEPSIKGMEVVYRGALQAIAENTAAFERLDAELPPIPTKYAKANGAVAGTADLDSCDMPLWPLASLRYEETGDVTLAFFVDVSGKLVRARKVVSSGYVELDHATLTGIAVCKFRPALVDGKPVASWIKLQYRWKLE